MASHSRGIRWKGDVAGVVSIARRGFPGRYKTVRRRGRPAAEAPAVSSLRAKWRSYNVAAPTGIRAQCAPPGEAAASRAGPKTKNVYRDDGVRVRPRGKGWGAGRRCVWVEQG